MRSRSTTPLPKWYTRPKTVTHPGSNRARRALTSFMRRTPLTTTPRRQPCVCVCVCVGYSCWLCTAVAHRQTVSSQYWHHFPAQRQLSSCILRPQPAALRITHYSVFRLCNQSQLIHKRMGNETVPKIITNDTMNICFSKTAISILVISNNTIQYKIWHFKL